MGIYLISYWLVTLVGMIKANQKKITILIGTMLFLILCFRRMDVGADLDGYKLFFDYIGTLDANTFFHSLTWVKVEQINVIFNGDLLTYKLEPGYLILNWVVSKLGLGFYAFLVICSAFFIISISVFFYRYSKDVVISFLLFCALGSYAYCFGILRQMISVCIILWAIPFIEKREIFKPLLLIVLAFLFHRTAIVALPLVLLSRVTLTKRRFLIVFFFLAISIVAVPIVLPSVVYNVYAFLLKGVNIASIMPAFSTIDFAVGVMLISVGIFYNFNKEDTQKDNIVLWSLLLLAFLRIIRAYFSSFSRSEQVFFVISYAAVPTLLERGRVVFKKKEFHLILASIFFVYYIHLLIQSPIVPYRLFWQG